MKRKPRMSLVYLYSNDFSIIYVHVNHRKENTGPNAIVLCTYGMMKFFRVGQAVYSDDELRYNEEVI